LVVPKTLFAVTVANINISPTNQKYILLNKEDENETMAFSLVTTKKK